MLARIESNLTVTEHWLAQLERALSDCDDALLKTLFHADSHWRDVLALTWRIMTVNGRDAIVRELRTHSQRACPVTSRYHPIVPHHAMSFGPARRRSRRSSHLKRQKAAAVAW